MDSLSRGIEPDVPPHTIGICDTLSAAYFHVRAEKDVWRSMALAAIGMIRDRDLALAREKHQRLQLLNEVRALRRTPARVA
jgi:purine nucleoside phosphorylase